MVNAVDLVFTDPPYNVAFNGRSGKHDVIKNDDLPKEEFETFIGEVCNVIRSVDPKAYSESRALGIAMRLIRKTYPHIEWVISFADGSQCGDGTIYRASGFLLTGIRRNTSIWRAPNGSDFSRTSLTDEKSKKQQSEALQIVNRTTVTKGNHSANAGGGASMKIYKEAGFEPIPGFQLRYLYFLNPAARSRLTVPILPFSKIEEMGAGMYRGQARAKDQASEVHSDLGGETPTRTLQTLEAI
jgi:hypothetical protein